MKKRVLSMLLAACLLIGLVPVLPAFAADAPELLYLAPSTASNLPSRIDLYPDPSGGENLYHLYLPGNAVAGNCFLSWEGGASASLGGRSYQSGALPIPAPGETETVTFGSKKFIIRTYQGSPGVKPIFIEIDESQGTIAAMNNDPNHNATCTGEIVIDGERMALPQIKGRGNATWRDDKEKKPYNIKLDTKVNILGIDCEKTKKWSLLSNVNDRTLLRNKVAYDLAHQMGIGFDSASADVWMNGVYWGTYLVTPKTDSFVSDDGYLIEDNNSSDSEVPHIDGTGMILNIKDIGENLLLAEGENIEDSATIRAAASKISSYFKEAWSAVTASDGKSSKGKHYSEYFDMDSMAAFYLLHEFIKNLEVDGGSIFIHRDGTADTDKLIAGPAWDYDNSMGYNGSTGHMASGGSGWPSRPLNYASLSIGNWYITGRNRGKLFGTFSKHQDFLDLTYEVYNRYYKLFDDVSANVRRQAALIADSAEMNFVRTVKETKNNFDFPEGNTCFDEGTEYEVNYKAAEVWPDYVDNLVTFTTGRARFFHDQMYVENTCEHNYKAVVTAPTCTEAGFTTHTCTKCGDSSVDSEVPALGHNFVNGVCTRCGKAAMKAVFVCDAGVSVTVYDKQDLTGAHENATEAFPRDSGTGEI
ncbi:MAG: CotH kinase family protein, partial [Oscillospiraceae bacterium]|nr:CotH kinase family protein [Oscillospiraceae bacterium]